MIDPTNERKRKVLNLLKKKLAMQKDKVLLNMKFGLIQKAFLLCNAKIVLLLGANRSGKSEVIACDALIRMGMGIPYSLAECYPEEFICPGEYWTACVDFNSINDIIKKKFERIGPKRCNRGYNKEEKRQLWEAPIGATEQRYKSYDQGREKFQGTSKNYISFDEEPPQDVFDESYMRTIDCEGKLRLGYTPIKGMTWGHRILYKKAGKRIYSRNIHSLPEEMGVVHSKEEIPLLKERELVEEVNSSPDADPDIIVYEMTIYDNVHLPDIEIWKAEVKYQDDPMNYNARILGRFTRVTGNNVYPCKTLQKRQEALANRKFTKGDIDDKGMFQSSSNGNLILFDKVKDIRDRLCVIGADIAEGIEGGDYSCAQILDHKTGQQLAIWWGHISPDDFARILYKLGKFFSMAWVCPERNFHGEQVVDILRNDLHYPRLWGSYTTTDVEESSGQIKKWGFRSTGPSKELITKGLVTAVKTKRIILNDINTVDELITVVYKKDRKIGAITGCHDDRERALAIAWHIWLSRRPKPYIPKSLKRRAKYKSLGEARQYGNLHSPNR